MLLSTNLTPTIITLNQSSSGNFLQDCPSTKVIDPPSTLASVMHGNSTVTSKLPHRIHLQLHEEPLIKTICKEAGWDKPIYDSVDWLAFGAAFGSLPKGSQITYSKLTHGIINTNAQNKRFYNKDGNCLCCTSFQESITHMLTCQETHTLSNRRKQQDALIASIASQGTHKQIVECIKYGLLNYENMHYDGPVVCYPPTYRSLLPLDVTLTQAIHAQSTIGWEHFLRGRVSLHWRKAYNINIGKHTSGIQSADLWTSNLIQHILKYSATLWSYRN
jgi:hypothetical protein